MLCDVAIDQGGCAETSRATTHGDPVYEVDGVTHYCVANMPGAVPITSTKALTNATLPYVRGDRRPRASPTRSRATRRSRAASTSLDGKITYEAVAEAHGLEYTPLEDVLAALGARLGRGLRSRSALLAALFGGLSLITSERDAGREADDRDDVDDDADEAEDRFHARPRIAACRARASSCWTPSGRGSCRTRTRTATRAPTRSATSPAPSAGSTCPNLEALGLGNVEPLEGCPPQPGAPAVAGRLVERSKGKDTTTGHWELMGVVTPTAMPTYPHGFPHDVIDPFMHRTGRGVLGNKAASGTEIIQELGEEHQRTGKWIVYTSADSVFQIAAHEETIPLEELYEALPGRARDPDRQARRRPRDRAAVRRRARAATSGRRTATTSRSSRSGRTTCRSCATPATRCTASARSATSSPAATSTSRARRSRTSTGSTRPIELLRTHRRAASSSRTSSRRTCSGATATTRSTSTAASRTSTGGCRDILDALRPGDLLVLTSDHGCDPTTPSTDHSREHALLLAYAEGRNAAGQVHEGEFADVGATVNAWLGGKAPGRGHPGHADPDAVTI